MPTPEKNTKTTQEMRKVQDKASNRHFRREGGRKSERNNTNNTCTERAARKAARWQKFTPIAILSFNKGTGYKRFTNYMLTHAHTDRHTHSVHERK